MEMLDRPKDTGLGRGLDEGVGYLRLLVSTDDRFHSTS